MDFDDWLSANAPVRNEADSSGTTARSMYETVLEGVRASNTLPQQREHDYFAEHYHPEYTARTQHAAKSIIQILRQLTESFSVSPNASLLAETADPRDPEAFEVVSNLTSMVDDEVTALLQRAQREHPDAVSTGAHITLPAATTNARFPDVDNSRTPFVPRLRRKPNAVEPLPDGGLRPSAKVATAPPRSTASSAARLTDHLASNLQLDLEAHDSGERYEKPIHSRDPGRPGKSPDAWLLDASVSPTMPKPVEECPPATWIDTPEALRSLAETLAQQNVFAVDLENHSTHSFLGYTCLMQVSTHEHDYLVDTIALRTHVGDALLDVFTNPAIVKVLHGADYDVEWLQRDFGLYIVNLFDTGQAARVLGYPSASLATTVQRHCK